MKSAGLIVDEMCVVSTCLPVPAICSQANLYAAHSRFAIVFQQVGYKESDK